MEVYKTYLDSLKSGNFNICTYKKEELKNVINILDESGRTNLHWAAFTGCKEAVLSLLDHGIDALYESQSDENFQAIHFATVNNHVDCIELLLSRNVSIESCDKYRRSPLSIACFYGRISTSVFLLSKGANLDHRDINGNTALHFAAMSCNIDLCQILIYSGINVRIQNDLGETPFHLACAKGSIRMIKSFLNVEPLLLKIEDKKGMTGFTHAKINSNKIVFNFLQHKLKTSTNILPSIQTKHLLYGGGGGSKCPLLFVILTIFFWGVPSYLIRIIYQTYSDWPTLNMIFIAVGLCFTVSLYAVCTSPGFLPRYTKEYDDILKGISLYGHNELKILIILSRLCHTCRTVRRLRAFHCGTCKRCVRDKDHHCPYIYNCVGFRNRQYFLLLLICLWIEFAIAIFFCYIIYADYGYKFAYFEYFGLFLMGIFFVFVNLILARTFRGAICNITTIESLKWKEYGFDYLRTESGKFKNPFNKGYLLNFLEFF